MHSFNIHWRIICEDIRTIDGVIYFILPFLSISLFSFSIPPPFFPFMTLVFPPLPSLTLSSSYFSVTTIVMITLHRWTSSMFFFPWFFSLILFYLSLSTSFCVLCVCVCVKYQCHKSLLPCSPFFLQYSSSSLILFLYI